MTWAKLSDSFGDEVAGLSDAAFRTHVEALLWTMRRETDGHLAERDVRRFAETADPAAAVQELPRSVGPKGPLGRSRREAACRW